MKVNGPNHTNFNPYKKQVQKQSEMKEIQSQKDKIEISQQAKRMQDSEKADPARQKLVNDIKMEVDAGNYQKDAKSTAKKMLDFWTNKS
ncbi:flagellar biosynthesis anti-sigma factor FlgM [Halobacillus yeomjeoni]|uniref:Negative regulator of flagellin synthesis n=1 Tax=Halobacillus yeomjeoni TaxID=311194 RepID=A0A931MVJ0_9BACI|nr:flagellar biosynthesis anti-sigma factor FlgM [Halobacillus yeomjeoni]MBH0230877.1 flagellar biosynthesis anti-sigma factor FlgM [Halobacillus yeomjeoni]